MNHTKHIQSPRLLALSAALIGGFSLNAQAQLMLEEVVVTSQKRVETLSDVPISVNVMSGDKIAQSGVTNLNDLADFVPNLSMNQTGISTTITIRGISSGVNPAFEQSVGMYVDDIHYGRMQMARIPYLDVDRVEVLRGPQPILFGKNAIGGAISVITKKASTEGVEGFISGEYNFDEEGHDIKGAINVPLSDNFAVRLSGLVREVDGYYENTSLDRDESNLEHAIGRANFQWDATDNLSMHLKYEYASFDTTGRFVEIVNPVGEPGSLGYGFTLNALSLATGNGPVELDTEQDFKRQSNGDIEETNFDNLTFNLEYALGEHTFTSVSGWVSYDYYQQCDCDFTDVSLIDTAGEEKFDQFSQEFRLTSPVGQKVEYIVGAFYQDYDIDFADITIIPDTSVLGLLLGIPGTGARRLYETESELWSVFAQLTFNITDTLRLTLGGRYNDEEKTGSRSITAVDIVEASPVRNILAQPITTNAVAPGIFENRFLIQTEQSSGHNLSGARSESAFTPALNIQWDATDSTMVYASVTQGFKAGGFDTRSNSNSNFEFEDEEALSYEIGAKMSLAGGAAELNFALYRTEYEDLQTSQFDGVLGFNVTNAGEATTQGAELDGRWQASENLLLTGSLAWLDFEFDSFPNSECYFGEPGAFTVARNGFATDYPAGHPLHGLCDRTGETREFTPELTANLGATYIVPIGTTMELSLGLDLAYSDEYFVAPTLDPNLVQDSYTKLNGRIGLDSIDGDWSVSVLLENITDEEILTFGNKAPVSTTLTPLAGGLATAYYGFYESPFNVALQARYNF